MTSLFIATGNAHKLSEIRTVLGPEFTVFSPRDARITLEPEETGATFADNARLKTVAWAIRLRAPDSPLRVAWVLADDSGLEVDALGGAPGVHSARFAALDDGRPGNSPDPENNAKLMRLLAAVPAENRRARFRCVLALTPLRPDRSAAELAALTHCFAGACEGRIAARATGGQGFGYDPLFVPDGYQLSFAELGEPIKNTLSHRARALNRLRDFFNGLPSEALRTGPSEPLHRDRL